MKIAIIDYGLGNLQSIHNAICYVGADAVITDSKNEIENADKIILPGVGAFQDGMKGLIEKNLVEPLHSSLKKGKPILGICLGAQLLTQSSEEFVKTKGLGFIDAETLYLPSDQILIPNTGWINTKLNTFNTIPSWLNNLDWNDAWFYYVHSLYMKVSNPELEYAYGVKNNFNVTGIIGMENLTCIQFHPEKSGKNGLELLKNYIEKS